MSIAKVINRLEKRHEDRVAIQEKRKAIIHDFRQFVLLQIHDLSKVFPSVVIGDSELGSDIVGLTYNPSTWSGNKTHTMGRDTDNIVMDSTKPEFHIGCGANSAGAGHGRVFKFDYDMNKLKLRVLFQQMLEYLVSQAYWVGYKNDRQHQVWMGYTQLI